MLHKHIHILKTFDRFRFLISIWEPSNFYSGVAFMQMTQNKYAEYSVYMYKI